MVSQQRLSHPNAPPKHHIHIHLPPSLHPSPPTPQHPLRLPRTIPQPHPLLTPQHLPRPPQIPIHPLQPRHQLLDLPLLPLKHRIQPCILALHRLQLRIQHALLAPEDAVQVRVHDEFCREGVGGCRRGGIVWGARAAETRRGDEVVEGVEVVDDAALGEDVVEFLLWGC